MSDNQQLTEIEQAKADAQELVRLNGLLTTAKTAAATAVENAAAAEFGSLDAVTKAELSKTKAQLVIDAAKSVKGHAKNGSAEYGIASADVTDGNDALKTASDLLDKSRVAKEYLDELNRLNGLLTDAKTAAATAVADAAAADIGSSNAVQLNEQSVERASELIGTANNLKTHTRNDTSEDIRATEEFTYANAALAPAERLLRVALAQQKQALEEELKEIGSQKKDADERQTADAAKAAAAISQGMASSIGDPYVFPLKSNTPVKLPNKNAVYRMYENGNTFINASVSQATPSHMDRIVKYASSSLNESLNKTLDRLIIDGYFYDKFFISVDGQQLIVDLQRKTISSKNNKNKFFKIKRCYSNVFKNEFFNETNKMITISWIENHKETSIDVMFFENPQVENGIRFRTDSTVKNAIGMLIDNYKPKLMIIPKINTQSYKKINKRITRLTRTHGNDKIYQFKNIISKSEKWA